VTKVTAKTATLVAVSWYALCLMGCKEQGPLERAGEEIDEAADTIKNGGKESTATKVDDAIDEARAGAKDAAKELKKD